VTALTHLVESSAARRPDAPAVRDGARTVRYGELRGAVEKVAAHLAAAGVGAGDRVGLLLPKSAEAIVGLLGAMRAGACYVPVDPDAPAKRARAILKDAEVAALVTTAAEIARRPGLLDGDGSPAPRTILIAGDEAAPHPDAVRLEEILRGPARPVPPHPQADDLAYILYTSGSTGAPKGVMLTHQNALCFVRWAADEIGLTGSDRLSSHAPLHFDLSVFDLYAAFLAGASLHLVPDGLSYFPLPLARWIDDEAITVWYSVPSILAAMSDRSGFDARPKALRTVFFAGEVFPIGQLRELQRRLPGADLINLYGPTETNVCTFHRVEGPIPEGRREPLPIGAVCPYDEALVMTDAGAPAEGGEEGELWVRGESVMRGYWNDAERSARSLVPGPGGGARYYRTGDYVRWNGPRLEFLGRRDAMIKSRGYRIELGDVEAALFDHPAVREAAALAVGEGGETHLHAAVALRENVPATPRSVQKHCLDILPRYMVPESVLILPELPRTSTGKVDRVSLAERIREGARTEV